MTIAEIIALLKDMGHEVKYKPRKDGGIRITNINGQKFSGSTGNSLARAMTGQALSERRTAQLGTIRTPKGKWGHKKRVEELDETTIKRIQKAQRLYRKNKVGKTATVTRKKYRETVRLYGKEEAERRLTQAIRYGQGLAYDENINWLVERIRKDMEKEPSSELEQAIQEIEARRANFKESWISAIYEQVYMYEQKRMTARELSLKILQIVRS